MEREIEKWSWGKYIVGVKMYSATHKGNDYGVLSLLIRCPAIYKTILGKAMIFIMGIKADRMVWSLQHPLR